MVLALLTLLAALVVQAVVVMVTGIVLVEAEHQVKVLQGVALIVPLPTAVEVVEVLAQSV
jgi:hypothetical protein